MRHTHGALRSHTTLSKPLTNTVKSDFLPFQHQIILWRQNLAKWLFFDHCPKQSYTLFPVQTKHCYFYLCQLCVKEREITWKFSKTDFETSPLAFIPSAESWVKLACKILIALAMLSSVVFTLTSGFLTRIAEQVVYCLIGLSS